MSWVITDFFWSSLCPDTLCWSHDRGVLKEEEVGMHYIKSVIQSGESQIGKCAVEYLWKTELKDMFIMVQKNLTSMFHFS